MAIPATRWLLTGAIIVRLTEDQEELRVLMQGIGRVFLDAGGVALIGRHRLADICGRLPRWPELWRYEN